MKAKINELIRLMGVEGLTPFEIRANLHQYISSYAISSFNALHENGSLWNCFYYGNKCFCPISGDIIPF
jgi:hypothetical protein